MHRSCLPAPRLSYVFPASTKSYTFVKHTRSPGKLSFIVKHSVHLTIPNKLWSKVPPWRNCFITKLLLSRQLPARCGHHKKMVLLPTGRTSFQPRARKEPHRSITFLVGTVRSARRSSSGGYELEPNSSRSRSSLLWCFVFATEMTWSWSAKLANKFISHGRWQVHLETKVTGRNHNVVL